jgi:hypothetical protein
MLSALAAEAAMTSSKIVEYIETPPAGMNSRPEISCGLTMCSGECRDVSPLHRVFGVFPEKD